MSGALQIPENVWGTMTPGAEQQLGLDMALEQKVLAITGGPGCGKTALTAAIVRMYRHNGLRVSLCAPTGRAAKRMAQQMSAIFGEDVEAQTIHRLAKIVPGKTISAPVKIECDVLVVDEMSMVSVILGSQLLSAVPDNARLLLVGDVDQLPAIGAGNMLEDILRSGKIPSVKLTQIFRQSSESRIPYVARDIKNGITPDLTVKGTDVGFIATQDCESELDDMQDAIVKAVTVQIPKVRGIPSSKIMVICAQYAHPIGVEALNFRLQEAINPLGDRQFIVIGGPRYTARAADRVMMKKNDYDLGVMNGEQGIVIDLNPKGVTISDDVWSSVRSDRASATPAKVARVLVIDFEGRKVAFTKEEAHDLHLAYAGTCHSMQGSSAEAVVSPVHQVHAFTLTRRNLYTMITRAEKFVLLVGQERAIAQAVKNVRGEIRKTTLRERLASEES